MRKGLAYLFLFLVALSCGPARRVSSSMEAPVQMPLENPEEIAAAEQRAREVLDSIDRVRSAAAKDSLSVSAPAIPEENPALPLEDSIIAYARSFTGVPYKLGASGPKQFDCSGFTTYVYKHFGYKLTQFSGAQFKEGREVENFSDLRKGDLVFFGKRGSVRNIGHVGIITELHPENGSFTFIHASVSRGVTEENYNHPYFMMRYLGARRILPE